MYNVALLGSDQSNIARDSDEKVSVMIKGSKGLGEEAGCKRRNPLENVYLMTSNSRS